MAKRPGRPPLNPAAPSSLSACLVVRLSTQQFDQLYDVARAQRMTMSECVRLVLTKAGIGPVHQDRKK